MKKSHLILLTAIGVFLVLLIGGGAAALAVQIRKNAAPTFTETERFLRQPPRGSGWTYLSHQAGRPSVRRVNGWWNYLGLSNRQEIHHTTYTLSHQASTGRGKIVISHHGETITRVFISGSFPEQATELETTFFRQFPKLRPLHAVVTKVP